MSSQPSDWDLLAAYAAHRDGAAFQELMRRHGGLVLNVCRRTLWDPHDIEDAAPSETA